MTLKLRIRKIEERLEHTRGPRMQTICFLCDSGVATQSQADAALAEYKANHPGWEAEDLIEIRVNADGAESN